MQQRRKPAIDRPEGETKSPTENKEVEQAKKQVSSVASIEKEAAPLPSDRQVDKSIEDSFPASDPPAWSTPTIRDEEANKKP